MPAHIEERDEFSVEGSQRTDSAFFISAGWKGSMHLNRRKVCCPLVNRLSRAVSESSEGG